MKLIVDGLAALAIGLAGVPVAAAEPGVPCPPSDPACHEFDADIPYIDAFKRHGIGHMVMVPLVSDAMGVCRGTETQESIYASWKGRDVLGHQLTYSEAGKIVEAARDVCPKRRAL